MGLGLPACVCFESCFLQLIRSSVLFFFEFYTPMSTVLARQLCTLLAVVRFQVKTCLMNRLELLTWMIDFVVALQKLSMIRESGVV